MTNLRWSNGRPVSVAHLCEHVGKGWTPLVTKLIEDLLAAGWDGEVFQIKEKFGGLRFYVGSISDDAYEFISKAEEDSFTICETCGQPGKLRGGGWWKTLCDQCDNYSIGTESKD